jgi:cation:H+ antiporter
LLAGSAVIIYFACEFFVNGVEWVGHRLRLTESATGTILAAFGTALPEGVVTLIAAAFGRNQAQHDVAVGAAMGGPLVLGTLAYGLVGLCLIARRRKLDGAHQKHDAAIPGAPLARDQLWFMVIFLVEGALGLVSFPGKGWFGWGLLAAYAIYMRRELAATGSREKPELEPLRLRPRDAQPSLFWCATQTLIAMAVIFAASKLFVSQIETVGDAFGAPAQLVALLLSPIATELPEIVNAIIWVRQGKVQLALSNVSGARMIQATVPASFGLFWTDWLFSAPVVAAAVATLVALAYLWLAMRRGSVRAFLLLPAAGAYVGFVASLFYLKVF